MAISLRVAPPPTPAGKASIVLACLAGFLGSGDTAVNIAFPAIIKRFGLDLVTIQWVVVAYVLTYAGLLLLGDFRLKQRDFPTRLPHGLKIGGQLLFAGIYVDNCGFGAVML